MLQLVIVILTALANVSIAAVVLRKNARSASHILLVTLSLVTATWTVFNYLALQPGSEEIRLFWVRLVMLVTTPFGTIIYLLARTFPASKLNVSPKRLIGLIVFNLVTGFLALTPFMFSDLKNLANGGFALVPAPGVALFGVGFIGFMTVGFIELGKSYRNSKGITRKQLQFLIIGLITSFTLLSLTNFVAVVVFGSMELTSMGPPFTLILFVLTAYSIIRHRLFNISKLIARAISYTLLISIVSLAYVLFFYLIVFIISPHFFDDRQVLLAVSTALSLLIATTLPVVKRFTDRVTDNIFYKDHFDQKKLFDALAKIMTSTFNVDDLAKKTTDLLHTQIRSAYTRIVLINDDGTHVSFQCAGSHTKELEVSDLDALKSLAKDITVYEEQKDTKFKAWMAQFELSLLVRMKLKGKAIGYILFGEKASGEIYYGDELDILPTIADQLAIAFENAISVLQISRFNVTLKDEVKKATHELKAANGQLKQLDKLKDEFVSLASHELRTPMTSIKGSISVILEGYAGKISPQAHKYLTAAFNENDRLIRLVNNLLNSSRIEAGRFTFRVTDVDLCQVITEIISNMQTAAAELNIYLKFKTQEDRLLVQADSDKIREVIINFIGNALKFTSTGGITVTAERQSEIIVIAVHDTGFGMKETDLHLLFRKFSQVDTQTGAKPVGGTGLGLYISKQIVEGLRGKIWVESELGKGTTFYFSLPVAQSHKKN